MSLDERLAEPHRGGSRVDVVCSNTPPGSDVIHVSPEVTQSAACAALAPRRYTIQFTASTEFVGRLRRAQTLLRHAIPDGNPGEILDRSLQLLLTLEFHHVVPFAYGGAATTANIELRCRAHNAHDGNEAFTPMLAD